MHDEFTEAELHAGFLAMSRYGGGFASALADAWFRADPYNRETIQKTWPDLTCDYVRTAHERGEVPRG